MDLTKMNSTKNHEKIKNWIQTHYARPARLGYDSSETDEKDPITVWFDSKVEDPEKSYMPLDWEEWFGIFDHYDYTFYYTETDTTSCCELVIGKPDAPKF